ncbi:uncharacterized protein PGTG_07938 [Puccinia graminis f. sp. tritici CRL 75-36-700-3]|uniref:Uncharacterized protein n=1 Tax=Puccinia graminis f. sp. tritici (strain CRL 75-36-700-3 / race SCCL) TaxID=418459 RepID=E3KBJ1_PUCGT|nr:uncharacterized protein PGTG_07938 [Puccinia graminis f. sp. tritici CRL 75-36-700-3]EFP81689.2 hypothetical protein PGTG_07938 [Puccinia graminis f. sp. tritici CRL 75-36-700-3]
MGDHPPLLPKRVNRLVALILAGNWIDLAVCLSGGSSNQRLWFNQNAIDSFSAHKTTPLLSSYNAFHNLLNNGTICRMDRSKPPDLQELVSCRNSSMFNVWRPKARVIAPRGWMNDPMGMFQTRNGNFHVGYQCSPQHLGWANISQCSASTSDFVEFDDYRSWEDPVTISPSQIYDIRGVFDGVVVKDGWNGHPTLIYTSAYVGEFAPRCEPPEVEGVETQSVAYTEDDGNTWTKLNFGASGNPIIYHWPEKNLSGFRDPFVFESKEFSKFYDHSSNAHQLYPDSNEQKPRGDKYLLLSGGIRVKADPINGGPRVFLYRQTKENDLRDWTYLGPILSFTAEYNQTSEWTGGNGINFEATGFSTIDEQGLAPDFDSSNVTNQLNIFTTGTEGARNFTHMDYWPVWHAVNWNYNVTGGHVRGEVDFSGVVDWGRAYAFAQFSAGKRQLIVGWVYEDDEFNVLTHQRGAQGAFTLFREMFVKVIRNIHPGALKVPEHAPSWTTKIEKDGSHSVVTFGQRILPAIKAAFYDRSEVTKLNDRALNITSTSVAQHQEGGLPTSLVAFEKQPKDRYYVIRAQLDFFPEQHVPADEPLKRPSALRGGFRILSGKFERTDIFYDPNQEYLVIDRSHSSTIPSYGNSTEQAKHRLWPVLNPVTNNTNYESLNLTIVVDNSVLEVHANERTIITTRVYPWCKDSVNVEYFVQGPEVALSQAKPADSATSEPDSHHLDPKPVSESHSQAVHFSQVELWDGLVNAWPNRPSDTSLPGLYSYNITSTVYGLWPDL